MSRLGIELLGVARLGAARLVRARQNKDMSAPERTPRRSLFPRLQSHRVVGVVIGQGVGF
jgi:hypothetical protein